MFTIHPCNNRDKWTEFLDRQAPPTFLQSWEWKIVNELLGSEVVPLGVFVGEALVGTALTIVTRARRGCFVLVPHGPILDSACDRETIWKLLLAEIKCLAQDHQAAFIRICPLLKNNPDDISFIENFGFRPAAIHQHLELTSLLDLTPSEDNLLTGMRKTTRQSIRKAEEAGMTVEFVHDATGLEEFWKVYETTVARQQFTPFSRAYLEAECHAFAEPGRLLIALGRMQGILVSAAIVTLAHGSAFYHHGASDQQHFSKIPAAHLLQWRLLQEAKRRGCHVYNFWGVVPETATKHPWYGLSLFKRGFGGREEAYLHAHDLVLSKKYWLTWLIETLRRKHRRL